ncbi:MAG: hypothetical protein A3B25_00165 [Candidatus Ryanbacteria bacterium RIFCSPLOWO2_01_FULL_48_26]|uniref:Glycosyltransferase subfamily 4-like N-terminal domain-containing protein n=1 Tax=Candidatus Ryanbacteria bacterium RIFCSPLOWO2_01_FULL_48_26 TaxID=1802126 RepID=A0A1G2GSY2_9BACT|nr:MAG: hypothetical protein A3B25_00165 [Candidatus Ryanbacteria bacterium RIFCSPLOWO2_01_FULL_48_26]
MKVLICTGIFPPEIGGPATYSRILASELKKRGHNVRVITYSGGESGIKNYELGEEFPVIRIPRSKFKLLHYWRYFCAVKRYGGQADLLYAQDPVSAGYPTYLAAKILRKPFAVKITGDYSWEQAMGRGLTDKLIDEFQTQPQYPKRIKQMRGVQIRVAKGAARVIVPSRYLKKIVTGWGVKEKQTTVVYNSIEPPRLPLSKAEARKDLNISERTFLIVSSGRKVKWKGFELLEKVVADLGKRHPNLELKILSAAPRAVLYKYFWAADLYVLNTGYEGLSNTLVEVLGIGVPIITTNVCGNPEIISNDFNGLLVDYNDASGLKAAIEKVYDNPELGRRYVENGKRILANFSLDRMIGQTLEVLQACVF